MFSFSAANILALLIKYKYLIIFPVAIVEGPILSIVCGFLVSIGQLNVFVAYGFLILADLVGDTLYYALGRFGRIKLVNKFGHYIGVTPEKVLKLEENFEKHDWKILIIGKTQAFGAVVLVAAGLAKANYWKFLFYNLLATIPKTMILIAIGFFFGYAVGSYLDYVGLISFAIFIILVLIYFGTKKYLKKKNKINIPK